MSDDPTKLKFTSLMAVALSLDEIASEIEANPRWTPEAIVKALRGTSDEAMRRAAQLETEGEPM